MPIEFAAFGPGRPLVLIAGPCVIESEEHVHRMACGIRAAVNGDFVFKASFDKANRSSGNTYRGPGLKEGLRILAGVKAAGFSVLTDIHEPAQAEAAAEVADILQIPAFLCRQTDLLLAAGRTGRIVNIKKGQFVAPHDIHLAAEKVASTGNRQIILTERGSSFGYNNLVVDMRGLRVMRDAGWPVVFDATHSVQLPGGAGRPPAGSPSSSKRWRAQRWLPASMACSSRCTTSPPRRSPTVPTPCGSACWSRSGYGWRPFTGW